MLSLLNYGSVVVGRSRGHVNTVKVMKRGSPVVDVVARSRHQIWSNKPASTHGNTIIIRVLALIPHLELENCYTEVISAYAS